VNIILEGPDNAGKTTLANALAKEIGWPIKHKEGRPKTWILLLEKLRKYEAVDRMIVDRHPIISQSVYGLVARNDPSIPTDFMDRFFERRDLIIYCRCISTQLEGHEPSDSDTPEHLKAIEENYQKILNVYDNWAAVACNIVYVDYDQMPGVIAMVKGYINECG
jgi:hypothetical protein